MDNHYTGQAYITTDEEGNQITAFHPGAMSFSHLNSIPTDRDISIGIVSPDGKEACSYTPNNSQSWISLLFLIPVKACPYLMARKLLKFIDQATWMTLNDYESELMQERTGLSLEQMAERVEALIITLVEKVLKFTRKGSASLFHLQNPKPCLIRPDAAMPIVLVCYMA